MQIETNVCSLLKYLFEKTFPGLVLVMVVLVREILPIEMSSRVIAGGGVSLRCVHEIMSVQIVGDIYATDTERISP